MANVVIIFCKINKVNPFFRLPQVVNSLVFTAYFILSSPSIQEGSTKDNYSHFYFKFLDLYFKMFQICTEISKSS